MSKDKMEMREQPLNVPTRNTTLVKAMFNLTKSAVGAGTLYIPAKFAVTGWGVGMGMLTFAALSTASTLHFLGRLAANTDCGDYFRLGKLAFGSVGEITAVASLLLFLIGGLIAYAELAGTFMNQAICNFLSLTTETMPFFIQPKFLSIILAATCIFPLSCLKDMSKLARASIAGMACMLYVTILTAAKYFMEGAVPGAQVVAAVPTATFASYAGVFSTLLFAFVNHFTMVALVPVMVDPSPSRRSSLIVSSSFTAYFIYVIVGLCGYAHFGNFLIEPSTKSIIQLASMTSTVYAIAQLAVSIVLILSFPLLCEPARAAFDQLLTLVFARSPSSKASWDQLSTVRHYGETMFIVSLACLIAVLVGNEGAEPVLQLFTAMCGSLLVFVFPAIYFLRLGYKFPVHTAERIVAWADILFGLVLCVYGTYSASLNLISALSGVKTV